MDRLIAEQARVETNRWTYISIDYPKYARKSDKPTDGDSKIEPQRVMVGFFIATHPHPRVLM